MVDLANTNRRFPGPIFLLGMMQRSGTNFLSDLLALHPECRKSFVAEDFFLCSSSQLDAFVEGVYDRWSPRWLVRQIDSKRLLKACIGRGLTDFVQAPVRKNPDGSVTAPPDQSDWEAGSRRVITKTPDVTGIHRIVDYFPDSKLLILVRDGRSVVESYLRTFGGDRDSLTRHWIEAARTILDFNGSGLANGGRHLIVRYEDLITDLDAELRRILVYLELDPSRYDFESAGSLPVIGSSDFSREKRLESWQKAGEKPENFRPLRRWEQWTTWQVQRFDWLAGEYLDAFSYERAGSATPGLFSRSLNTVVDVTNPVIRPGIIFGARVIQYIKRRLH